MNSASRIQHPLNKSSTKQTYSFSKSNRFRHTRRISTQVIYQLPSTNQRKSCSFGVGNKISLALKSSSPPPGTYNLPSPINSEKIPSLRFLKGRDEDKFGNYLEDAKKNSFNPSPNAYQPFKQDTKKRGGRMAAKLPTFIDLETKKQNPGPGSYSNRITDLRNSGSYILSNFKNQKSVRYHSPSEHNLPKTTQISRGVQMQREHKLGSSTVISKYKNSLGFSFSKGQRPSLANKSALNNPKFKYKNFSQFGGLEN